jgi:DNA-binding PucR family transcriptional regulator
MSDLIDSVLTPLAAARGGAQPLLDTISAYAAAGANAAATGRRLHLSVRAVTYRLTRVHQLTGLDPGVPEQLYVLHTAALGARLLGWPR